MAHQFPVSPWLAGHLNAAKDTPIVGGSQAIVAVGRNFGRNLLTKELLG